MSQPFDLGSHPDGNDQVDQLPDHPGHCEDESADREDADQLHAQVASTHDTHGQRTPDAREEVGGHGADHVVDSNRFQQFHPDRADDAADRPDDEGPVVLHHVGSRSDRDQTRDGAVQTGE